MSPSAWLWGPGSVSVGARLVSVMVQVTVRLSVATPSVAARVTLRCARRRVGHRPADEARCRVDQQAARQAGGAEGQRIAVEVAGRQLETDRVALGVALGARVGQRGRPIGIGDGPGDGVAVGGDAIRRGKGDAGDPRRRVGHRPADEARGRVDRQAARQAGGAEGQCVAVEVAGHQLQGDCVALGVALGARVGQRGRPIGIGDGPGDGVAVGGDTIRRGEADAVCAHCGVGHRPTDEARCRVDRQAARQAGGTEGQCIAVEVAGHQLQGDCVALGVALWARVGQRGRPIGIGDDPDHRMTVRDQAVGHGEGDVVHARRRVGQRATDETGRAVDRQAGGEIRGAEGESVVVEVAGHELQADRVALGVASWPGVGERRRPIRVGNGPGEGAAASGSAIRCRNSDSIGRRGGVGQRAADKTCRAVGRQPCREAGGTEGQLIPIGVAGHELQHDRVALRVRLIVRVLDDRGLVGGGWVTEWRRHVGQNLGRCACSVVDTYFVKRPHEIGSEIAIPTDLQRISRGRQLARARLARDFDAVHVEEQRRTVPRRGQMGPDVRRQDRGPGQGVARREAPADPGQRAHGRRGEEEVVVPPVDDVVPADGVDRVNPGFQGHRRGQVERRSVGNRHAGGPVEAQGRAVLAVGRPHRVPDGAVVCVGGAVGDGRP